VTEERFWRNYFYRVTLLKQALELSHQPPTSTPRAVPAAPVAAPAGAAPEPPAADGSFAKPAVATAEPSAITASTSGNDPAATPAEAATPDSPRAESPAPALPATASSVEPSGDFDWEKELEKELGDYKAPTATAPLPVGAYGGESAACTETSLILPP